MSVFDSLLGAFNQCDIVDLSRDVSHHANGPFQTRVVPLEPEPGAQFFLDNVLPRAVPEAVGAVRAEDFPGKAFLRHEMVTASTHAGSHVDAPGHYGPGQADAALWINQAPLSIFIAPGVLYDASDSESQEIGLGDLHAFRTRAGATDVQNKIVLFRTGGDKAISAAVVEALLDGGARVIGVDTESFDGPVAPMIRRFLTTKDSATLWPCHMLGRRRPYYQLERLTNLDRLPPSGFFVLALPIRIEGATAAWSRVVALVPRASSTH